MRNDDGISYVHLLYSLYRKCTIQQGSKGVMRDTWFAQKIARDTWKQLKYCRDPWICDPAWRVIFSLERLWFVIPSKNIRETRS